MLIRLIICLLLLGFGQESWAQLQLKVMTYNIRYNNPKDGENAWPNRKEKVTELVLKQKADIIGMQEALVDQVEFLDENLSGYARVGVGRDDGQTKGEFSPIYYDKDRFSLRDNGTFWLSKTPEIPGSKSWDAAITRICTYVYLIENETNQHFWVFNTHFDHKGNRARTESSKLILNKAKEMVGNEPFVLLGDLNFTPESEGYALLENELTDVFICYREGPTTTGKGFEVGKKEGGRIDHILFSKKLRCESYSIIDKNDGTWYPSDHLPVVSTLRFN